jgi:hypothetical protein
LTGAPRTEFVGWILRATELDSAPVASQQPWWVSNPEKHFRVITSGEAITLKVKI